MMGFLTSAETGRPTGPESLERPGSLSAKARFNARACFVILGLVIACSGKSTQRGTAPKSTCEEANDYFVECGATNYVGSCDPLTPDVECEARCDLAASCAYFLGDNPSEGRAISMCSSQCTCESAMRRAAECNLSVDFDCTAVCNCPYAYECDTGIPAYAECRARCPPWPDPPDAGNTDRDAG